MSQYEKAIQIQKIVNYLHDANMSDEVRESLRHTLNEKIAECIKNRYEL